MIFTDYNTGRFLFWTFQRWEIRSFLRLKVDGKMIFTDYWKVLVSDPENFLFWTFWRQEMWSFLSKKLDRKVMFTWSFWVFQDIPRPLKYGFRAVIYHVILLSVKFTRNIDHLYFITFHLSHLIKSDIHWKLQICGN